MTIRMAALAACAIVLAGAAQAEPHWKGAGWYVVADTMVGWFVTSGPYASKEECEPQRLPNEDEADYICEYLAERPSWDF